MTTTSHDEVIKQANANTATKKYVGRTNNKGGQTMNVERTGKENYKETEHE